MRKTIIILFALVLPASFFVGVSAAAEAGYEIADGLYHPLRRISENAPIRFHIVLKADFQVRKNPDTEKLIVTLPIPPNTDSQKILTWEVSPPPVRTIYSRYGYRFLEFELGPGYVGEKLSVRYEADVDLSRIRYEIDPNMVGYLKDIPEQIRKDYTADGEYYKINSPAIKKAAAEAVGKETNPYLMALKIWQYVRGKLHYKMDGRKQPADRVLRMGQGSCTEYSFLMIALCRASGIPARFTAGSVARLQKHRTKAVDEAFHKIIEIYIPNYGWIPVESSGGNSIYGKDLTNKLFGSLNGRMLFFVYEPEEGLVAFDPRRNTASYRSSGPGNLDLFGTISTEWTLVDKNRLNEQVLIQEQIQGLPHEGDEPEDPSNY
jgi:transglutaminase-like putative cysteine protease